MSTDCVDPLNESSLRHWARQLRCNAEQLRHAVTQVGSEISEIREYLAAVEQAPETRLGFVYRMD